MRKVAGFVVDRLARHAGLRASVVARVERVLVHVVVLVAAAEWRLVVRSIEGIGREVQGV